jgi:tricorn protease
MRGLLTGLVLAAALTGAASEIAAETQEPQWLRYPAVSPDGAEIAFSYGGRLYVVPAAGGAARALTTSDVFATRPVWSPDGRTIAFAADRFGNLDVFAMPADGGAATRLTYHSGDDLPTGFSADGTQVLFTARRLGDATAVHTLASPRLNLQLYAVPLAGGRERMWLPILAHEAQDSPDGKGIAYEDQPSIEQIWRKHDVSAQAHDVWIYDKATGRHTRISGFAGEDRDPAWSGDGQSLVYLSERSGSLNVWSQAVDPAAPPLQLTFHSTLPVRFVTVSVKGDLVYSYDGGIWRLTAGVKEPERVAIHLPDDALEGGPRFVTFDYGATEFALSPSGREVAFVVRGEVFVMSADGQITRRVTTTPSQERSVSFSPDGRTLLYAAERDGSWGLWQTSIALDEEPDFFDATLLAESLVLDTPADEFQPLYDPAGERVAYLEERDAIRVLDLATGETKEVLSRDFNYSYADGDLWYAWSPDGRWLAASHAREWSNADVGILDTTGNEPPRVLVPNGFYDWSAQFSADGEMVVWMSDILGLRRTDQNSEQSDVLIAALTQRAADRLQLSQKDYDRLVEKEAAEEAASATEGEEVPEGEEVAAMEPAPGSELDFAGADRRVFRLTPFSSSIGFYHLTADGENLIFVSYTQAGDGSYVATGYNLHHRDNTLTQLFSDLPVDWINGAVDADEAYLWLAASAGFYKIDIWDGTTDYVYYSAEMPLDAAVERRYIFDHVWRQTAKKFYRPDLHGYDWDGLHDAYGRYLPHISNGRDFAEFLGEFAGELNASHMGSGYSAWRADGDDTGELGLFYDTAYQGPGVKVADVLTNGPADTAGSRILPGVVITAVDGVEIGAEQDIWPFLNRATGRAIRLSLTDPASGETWDQVVTPTDAWTQWELAYWHWVEQKRDLVETLSGGRIGYIHVRAMDEESYRVAYANIFGRYAFTEALLVDVRFNNGGNLTNQLLTLLSGETYLTSFPGDRGYASPDPYNRWTRPSAVLTNPAAYSDGHIFPFSYKELGIGPLVGEPVPGTGTWVWWEDQQDPSLYWGIPQGGIRDNKGAWLENTQLEPDLLVPLPPEARASGLDPQLEAGVKLLLEGVE